MRAGWWKNLYVQVLVAIAIGALLGYYDPVRGVAMQPFGDAFIALVKMIIAPVIFMTMVVGMARMGDLRHVGRIGVKALVYFEVLTTIALVIGLLVANLVKPGAGMSAAVAAIDPGTIADYRTAAAEGGVVHFLQDIIPHSFVSAFVDGNLLQVLLV